MTILRRELLSRGLGLGATLAFAPKALATRLFPPTDVPFKISLAQWSLHRTLRSGKLSNLDFARYTKEEFGIEAVEYVNQFFHDKATDFVYLAQMRDAAEQAGVKSLLIMIDGEGALADADEKKRDEALENHFKWIAAASFLGCHSIRVNAAGATKETWSESVDRAADSLSRLGRIGDNYDINVIVENHGGLSSNGAWLARAIEAAEHPGVGTLPDFGNFRIQGDEWYDRYLGMEELMPFAKAVSAKSNDFDEDGNEVHSDYRRMLKIVLDAG